MLDQNIDPDLEDFCDCEDCESCARERAWVQELADLYMMQQKGE